jgi:predicted DNA-binding transcriptional regulator AlpA
MRLQNTTVNPVRDPEYLDRLLTETEAAQFIGFSIRALQGWRVKGGGPKFVKVSGRAVRYRRCDLILWAEARLRSNTSEGAGDGH